MRDSANPLVSIIIPCYKAEKYLPEALESVSNQTYTNWEVIAVNDCWRDRTEFILSDFKKINPQKDIIYLSHSTNQGPAATRNTGLQAASGNLIAFLDHDDVWESNHLSLGIKSILNAKADIFFSSVLMFNSNQPSQNWIWGATNEDMADFNSALFNRNFIPPSAAILTKKIIDRIGLMDISSVGCEDHDYWLRAIRTEAKFFKSETITVRYRSNNPKSLSSNSERIYAHDLIIQKKHYNTKPFLKNKQKIAISGTYSRLSLARWKSKPFLSVLSQANALYWNPKDQKILRRLIKGILLLPLFLIQKFIRNSLTPTLKSQMVKS